MKIRKLHSSLVYAFSIPNFNIKFGCPNLLSKSRVNPWVIKILSTILLPRTNPICQPKINSSSRILIRFVNILEVSFELKLQRLIGYSFHCYAPGTFGLVNPLGFYIPSKNSWTTFNKSSQAICQHPLWKLAPKPSSPGALSIGMENTISFNSSKVCILCNCSFSCWLNLGREKSNYGVTCPHAQT